MTFALALLIALTMKKMTSEQIAKAIKKNSVKLKYGTHVYLINSKENRKENKDGR